MGDGVIVLKFGGSVLTREADLPTVAGEIARHLCLGLRVIAVVSAIGDTTDRLLEKARDFCEPADAGALAALLATGEAASSALLGLTLARAATPAGVLDAAAIGLRVRGPALDAAPVGLNVPRVHEALERRPVLVVPGFVGVRGDGSTALLGRGGSDLSALFIASRLGARCRLVKDVDGLYERDPATETEGPRPRRYRTISYEDALRLDGAIVQHKGVRFARSAGLRFEVGCIGGEPFTVVGGGESLFFESAERELQEAGR